MKQSKGVCHDEKKIINTFKPVSFILLDDFHKSTLHPKAALYIHKLKQQQYQAMPEIIDQEAEQLLLYYNQSSS